MPRFSKVLLAVGVWAFSAVAAIALPSSQGQLQLAIMAEGLDEPWSFGFLPDDGFLVSERAGTLSYSPGDGNLQPVRGIPKIADIGQGGLLDILVPSDFATTRRIYLSYAKRQKSGQGTAIGYGRLSEDNRRLEGFTQIFEMAPGSRGGRHFGSRIVEATDGTLFVTLGERGDRPAAQELSNHNGTIIRITKDGHVPASNPFVGQAGAQPHIWSYGHRNPQGAALDLSGQLWAVEHGARGGDEVNKIRKAANYGWPVIAYGRHYSGAKIGDGTTKQGMEQPAHYWDPSIAPSGMMIYSGKLWPEWRGDIFVGSLKFDYISRLDGTPLREQEQIQSDQTIRVRDIREAPDGTIWYISVGDGVLYKLSPAP
ncbi:MAG: PQQ-dependent sugar dehydrogenase [Mangrovicoccus sp.]